MTNTNASKINHIGVSISVPDINDAINWYKKIFGFTLIRGPETIVADDSIRGLVFKDIFGSDFKEVKVAWLSSGNQVGFEIFQFIDPKAERRTNNSFEYWRSGFFHICITVPNIEEICEKICNTGGRLRSKVHKPFADKEKYQLAYCEDPYGNIIEILTHDFEEFITAR
jgi:catechol 2,3-dioxygenase-like lactoylglutathione lyase family enzyme